jgi:hypothetical protein
MIDSSTPPNLPRLPLFSLTQFCFLFTGYDSLLMIYDVTECYK